MKAITIALSLVLGAYVNAADRPHRPGHGSGIRPPGPRADHVQPHQPHRPRPGHGPQIQPYRPRPGHGHGPQIQPYPPWPRPFPRPHSHNPYPYPQPNPYPYPYPYPQPQPGPYPYPQPNPYPVPAPQPSHGACGYLAGNYYGACRATPGTTAISFAVVDQGNSCLVANSNVIAPTLLQVHGNQGHAANFAGIGVAIRDTQLTVFGNGQFQLTGYNYAGNFSFACSH